MREQFDQIIGTPPPSTIDTYVIERRVRRARQASVAGIAVTATVAVGLTGVLLVGNDPPAAEPPVAKETPTAAPSSTTASPPDNRIQLKAGTKLEGDASAKQLAALIEKATKDVAPGAAWTGPLTVQFIDGSKQWTGSGALKANGRTGTVFIMTLGTVHTALTCPPGMVGCAEGTSPGGRKMMTFDGGKIDDGSRLVRVGVELPGGWVIILHHTPDKPTSVLTVQEFLQIFDAVAAELR